VITKGSNNTTLCDQLFGSASASDRVPSLVPPRTPIHHSAQNRHHRTPLSPPSPAAAHPPTSASPGSTEPDVVGPGVGLAPDSVAELPGHLRPLSGAWRRSWPFPVGKRSRAILIDRGPAAGVDPAAPLQRMVRRRALLGPDALRLPAWMLFDEPSAMHISDGAAERRGDADQGQRPRSPVARGARRRGNASCAIVISSIDSRASGVGISGYVRNGGDGTGPGNGTGPASGAGPVRGAPVFGEDSADRSVLVRKEPRGGVDAPRGGCGVRWSSRHARRKSPICRDDPDKLSGYGPTSRRSARRACRGSLSRAAGGRGVPHAARGAPIRPRLGRHAPQLSATPQCARPTQDAARVRR
jgi:hypothetical protein